MEITRTGMTEFTHLIRLNGLALLLVLLCFPAIGVAEEPSYTWTLLQPQNDSRDKDVRDFDVVLSDQMIDSMNENEKIFHHRLKTQIASIHKLLSISAPFCELDFDAVKPQVLTHQEKDILKEYFKRGGFIIFSEDAYPYSQDEFWKIKEWPVIDFITKELSASDPNFTYEKINKDHPLYHAYYKTNDDDFVSHESVNPYSPYRILVSYRGHPCAFVDGQYNYLVDDKWVAIPRPFPTGIDQSSEGYALTVNLYVYATMH